MNLNDLYVKKKQSVYVLKENKGQKLHYLFNF